jgi:hypothetical protein
VQNSTEWLVIGEKMRELRCQVNALRADMEDMHLALKQLQSQVTPPSTTLPPLQSLRRNGKRHELIPPEQPKV